MSTACRSLDSLRLVRSPRRCLWRYSPGRWVWWNAAAKSRVLRLEALPRSLPLGSQPCLFCVSHTHPVWGPVLVLGQLAPVRDGLGSPRAAGSGGDAESGSLLRSVGEIGSQRAVDQVR